MLSIEAREALSALAERLRAARLQRNESQGRFAARLAISVPTLRKLERGDPTVSVGVLAEALFVLGRLGDVDRVLAPAPEDPFARWEAEAARKQGRRRASAPRKKP